MNQSKGYQNPIPSLVCDDTVILDDVGRASQYFSSVFTNEDLDSLPDVKSSTVLSPDLIDLVQFTPEVVLTFLPFDKVCGLDLLPDKLFKKKVLKVFVCHFPICFRNLLIGRHRMCS